MTTTEHLQTKPLFYSVKRMCIKNKVSFNPRYPNFNQLMFTAGDEEQFQKYRDYTNSTEKNIEIDINIFKDYNISGWEKYENLSSIAVINTFRYIFHKYKKGIFVKILNNELKVFLPFSKYNFVNEWSDNIKVDPKYGSIENFLKMITIQSGYNWKPYLVNKNVSEWYGNNCIVRYDLSYKEKLPSEGDTNTDVYKNLLLELCAKRQLPDIEFFINRRDFPILTKDGTEAYNHLFNGNIPLVSHLYPKYVPILSMSTTDRYADILIPTMDDWVRVQSLNNIWFSTNNCVDYDLKMYTNWEKKIPTAVFRGSSTGCGVTIETNNRLKVAFLSKITPPDMNGIPYLDAGITKWNLRPRKLENENLQTIDKQNMPFNLVDKLNYRQQSKYKYIINIDGHVSAFRLSVELGLGSVVLLVKSKWKIWYSSFLKPYKHYVPVAEDLSDLIEQIKWCRNNDSQCKQIAQNSKLFFETYLQKEGILDFVQKTFINIKNIIGTYNYNKMTPLQHQLEKEKQIVTNVDFPNTNKNIQNINLIPNMDRCFPLLKGIHLVINMVLNKEFFKKANIIYVTKLTHIKLLKSMNFFFIIKTNLTEDKNNEIIHETFVGLKGINKLLKTIPNFSYIFGTFFNEGKYNMVKEHIEGISLYSYINSPLFNMDEFIYILLQISFALQIAQNNCAFVHNDLTPWNIILQKTQEKTYDYIIDIDKIYRIKTSLVPIIIDYGKSHIIYNNEHYGFINMFKTSTIQDIIVLLLTSIYNIAKLNKQYDEKKLVYLSNFISNTRYCPTKFENKKDIIDFMKNAKKYSNLIEQNKYELEQKNPYDFILYILKKYNQPNINITQIYNPIMNKGNERQVFDFILSNTTNEKIKSYLNVLIRFKKSIMPQSKKIILNYYIGKNIEHNIDSTLENFILFLKENNISQTKQYINIFKKHKQLLHRLYKDFNNKNKNIYKFDKTKYTSEIKYIYNEDIFLEPEKINKILQENKHFIDITEYKNMLQYTYIDIQDNSFNLPTQTKTFFKNKTKNIIQINSVAMKNNFANFKTLEKITKNII